MRFVAQPKLAKSGNLDLDLSSDIKGMSALQQIREKAHKDGLKKNEDTISSYLVRKARRVNLDDMQKWDMESDCSSWEYSSVHKNRSLFEQHWQSLYAGLYREP